MDGVSLAVGLFSLFSTCVECFEYFEAARGFSVHYAQILTKLELQKIRLLAWGDAVGVLNAENEDQALQIRDIPIIEKTLHQIKGLLLDANNLQQKYGVTESTADASEDPPVNQRPQDEVMRTLGLVRGSNILSKHSSFWKKYKSKPRPRPVAKTVWAIRDKAKFEDPIEDLKGFIDDLNDLREIISPEKVRKQNGIIRLDIESIPSATLPDINNLRIIEASCSDVYPDWAEAARSQIAASELATRDDNYIQRWNRGVADNDASTAAREAITTSAGQPDIPVRFHYDNRRQLYFMLTESCLRKPLSQRCDRSNFTSLTSNSMLIHCAPITDTSTDVAQKIYKAIDFNILGYSHHTDFFLLDNQGQQSARKLITVYIYCAPCPCLIDTALQISLSHTHSDHLDFEIRIDPRLRVDCCPSLLSGVERLKSLQAASDKFSRANLTGYPKSVDFYWIDQIVFAAEDEHTKILNLADSRTSYRQLLNHYDEATVQKSKNTTVTLVLGDTDYLVPFMDSFDCIRTPRVPTVGQIWQVYYTSTSLGWRWIRRPWQRYTLSNVAWMQKELSESMRLDRDITEGGMGNARNAAKNASNLASPPLSVTSKRRRSVDESERPGKKIYIAETEEGS